ncbi:MAG: dicarboxylate/amino acid:cation symporter, partial [Candidatus Dadabacteria bacterium]
MNSHRWLLWGVAAGVAAGGALGWWAPAGALRLAPVGDLFLNALKALVLPLVFCSMVDAVAGIAKRGRLGRMAALTFAYY